MAILFKNNNVEETTNKRTVHTKLGTKYVTQTVKADSEFKKIKI